MDQHDQPVRERWVADSANPIPGLDVPRAKRYSRLRLALLLSQTAASAGAMAWFALSGRSAGLRRSVEQRVPDRRLTAPAYLAAASVGAWALRLPFDAVRDLVVERRYGLTRQTTTGWAGDQVKGLAVNLVVGLPLATAAHGVLRRRPRDWWFLLASATVPVSVVFAQLAPVVLLPIFNRFEPLRDEALEARIRRLSERAGVPIAAVYRMDMSRQTEKPNAFFTGLGRTKRIVLADTLLDRFEPDEIEGIVAHELGHQVHGDIWRFIALGSAVGYGVSYLAHHATPRLIAASKERTRVSSPGDVASVPLIGLVLSLAGFVAAPLTAAFSRATEARTDRYALELTRDGDAYARALTKLAVQSLADPDPSPPVVFFLYSHPPIGRRIADARVFLRIISDQYANA
ncbi:MAG: endopeptidase [Thermomicrobiales bacterium]|jgi:STE24 endopeptidase|nr:endopeptidase [Thermomicrobiales bacterium]